ncbi:MAG: RNA polymerase sigma factor SigA [Bacteroidia bacterium]|nr:RNA polymerase sigma factor SigA [Bacteroidia bacterium]
MRQFVITQGITEKQEESFYLYLRDIANESILSTEEEIQLAERIKLGDRLALEKLTRANLKFVVSVAKQYQYSGLTLPDLINEGNLGLILAAQKFDASKGFRFITYAVWWIRQSIINAISEKSRAIKIPRKQADILNKIKNASRILEQRLEREPTLEELSEHLNLPEEKISALMGVSNPVVSVDKTYGDDEDFNIKDVIANPDNESGDQNLLDESLKEEIKRSLSKLEPKEREVLQFYYGLGAVKGLELEEISKAMNLSTERIRQMKERALRRLRLGTRGMNLRNFQN